jgi:hypothetical protein
MANQPKATDEIEIRFRLSPTVTREEELYALLSALPKAARSSVAKDRLIELFNAFLHPADRVIERG